MHVLNKEPAGGGRSSPLPEAFAPEKHLVRETFGMLVVIHTFLSSASHLMQSGGGCKGAIIEMLSAINMEEASPNAIVNTFGIFLLIIKYLKSFLFQVGSRTAG